MALKNNLLKIRLRLGYKYGKDFAQFLNINKNQYSRYESHSSEPSLPILYEAYKKVKIIDPNIHFEDFINEDIEQD